MLESIGKAGRCAALVASIVMLAAFAMGPAINADAAVAPQAGQRTFDSPDAAAAALVEALKSKDMAALVAILGVKSKDALLSGDEVADRNDVAGFIRDYDQMHRFANGPDGKYYLLVGARNWPMPFPIATKGSKWFFDTAYGESELRYRRIGRNELDALAVLSAAVRAQDEYYHQTHDGQTHQYAAKLLSDPGKHNGL